MKWLRWWHLVPLFVIMMGCLGYFGKTKLIDPAEAAYKAALADFENVRNAATAKEADYKKALEERPQYCKTFINDARAFAIMQNTMPNIHCMAVEYANNKEEGLRKWYYIMGKGQTLNELRRWVGKFPATKKPKFKFGGTLGYETTLPTATIVKIPFEEQTVRVRGYNELAKKIVRMTGYGYCPYVVKFVGTDIAAAPAAAPAAGGAPGAAPGAPAAPATPAPPAAPAQKSSIINGVKISSHINSQYQEPYRGYYIGGGFVKPNIRLAQAPAPAPAPATGTPPATGAPAAGAPAAGAPAAAAPAAGGGSAGPLTITVIKEINGKNVYDPVRPILEFKYTAEAYFMTRGWDPYGDGSKIAVKTKIEEALKIIADPGKPDEIRKKWNQELPGPMLWFIPFPEPRMW